MMPRRLVLNVVILLFSSTVLVPSEAKVVSLTQEMMGTFVRIQIETRDCERAKAAAQEAFQKMRQIEEVFSLWMAQSEICRVNWEASQNPVRVNPPMKRLLTLSLEISKETGGAFDVTIMPLAMRWKKSFQDGVLPSSQEILYLKNLVDYRKVQLQENLLFMRQPGMKLDFGGIAKGYAVDEASKILFKCGFRNFIVGASGDLYVSGHKPYGDWSIGIQHPRIENQMIETLAVKDQAISTSGDYEQYLIKGNRRYHHLIDPRTGYPAMHHWVSVTVLASASSFADAYATAFFIMGPAKTKEFIKTHPGLKAVFMIQRNGKWIKVKLG